MSVQVELPSKSILGDESSSDFRSMALIRQDEAIG